MLIVTSLTVRYEDRESADEKIKEFYLARVINQIIIYITLVPYLHTMKSTVSICIRDWQASLVAQMVKNPPSMWETWV